MRGGPAGMQRARRRTYRGERGRSLTGGLEAMTWMPGLMAGRPHLQRPALPPVMLAGGAKGRQQAAAAAEQLLGYADCPVYPAPSPRPVSPPSS